MLVRTGEHGFVEVRTRAEPADDVMTRDFYTQLPQIRLSVDPTSRSAEPLPSAEVTLDGNDIAALVECAVRHPSANMRYAGAAAIWQHPNSFRQIFRFGLDAPLAPGEIRDIVAEQLGKSVAASRLRQPALTPRSCRECLCRGTCGNRKEQSELE